MPSIFVCTYVQSLYNAIPRIVIWKELKKEKNLFPLIDCYFGVPTITHAITFFHFLMTDVYGGYTRVIYKEKTKIR